MRFEILALAAHQYVAGTGAVELDAGGEDFDEKRLKAAQSVVYSWPSREAKPTKVQDQGRFPKSFPLEFPKRS